MRECFVSASLTLKFTLMAKNSAFRPYHPKGDQNPQLSPLSETTRIPDLSTWEFLPSGETLMGRFDVCSFTFSATEKGCDKLKTSVKTR